MALRWKIDYRMRRAVPMLLPGCSGFCPVWQQCDMASSVIVNLLTTTVRSDRLLHGTQSMLSRRSKRLRFGIGAVMTISCTPAPGVNCTFVRAYKNGTFEWGLRPREVAVEI